MKYCFLILHYVVIEETINCVSEIIEKFKTHDYRIVIVDNCSPNNSGIELQKKYDKYENVDVLINSENEGFARGNNFGYKYVLKKYDPDYIIIMNNDVEIKDSDFLNKIDSIFMKEQFHILGPDIYSTTFKVHQSPKRLKTYSYKEVLKINNKYKDELKKKTKLKIKCFLKNLFWLRKIKYQYQMSKIDHNVTHYNVILHGACIIYSKLYTQRFENAFFPETFFYYECEILDYICHKEKLKTVYSPDIKIFHHQNVSTNKVYKNIYAKTLFALKCNIDSTSSFLKLIKSSENVI